jgi:transposase
MDIVQTAPQTVILAEDEMSLYLQATTMRVWAPRGQTPLIRADPSRQKTCFYGSLNLQSGHEVVLQSALMNSHTTAEYLELLLCTYPDPPLLLFWDRAPWHYGAPIRRVLEANPRLEVIYFPVASPELNPQEHVWKNARAAVSHNHALQQLPELAGTMQSHLGSTVFPCSFLHDYGYLNLCPIFI